MHQKQWQMEKRESLSLKKMATHKCRKNKNDYFSKAVNHHCNY